MLPDRVAASPLVLTKLLIPPVRGRHISRQHLFPDLDPASDTRLLLASATAGFGKTSLLAEWAHRLQADGRAAVAWYTLDRDDDVPARFTTYLITAIARALGDGERLPLLARSLQADPDVPIEPALALAINALVTASRPMVIVLDDYHLISAPAIHAAIDTLLTYLPPGICLAIGTRADPPLSLARLRVHGQLVELRAADLRLTRAEMQAYLSTTLGFTPSDHDLQQIEVTTEGWPAGLHLLALSLARHDTGASSRVLTDLVARFQAGQRQIFEYLADEVFTQQPAEVRDFLVDTAILDRLCGDLCDAVRGVQSPEPGEHLDGDGMLPPSQTLLEALAHANLFVTPLDNERGWYRYHHLFSEFLRDRLLRERPERIPRLHHRASRWYERLFAGGSIPAAGEAIHHALEAGQVATAVVLIEDNVATITASGNLAALRSWIDTLPREVVRARPRLSLARAWAVGYSGDVATFEQVLHDAEASLGVEPPETRVALHGEIVAMRAILTSWRWDATRAAEYGRRALHMLGPQHSRARAIALQALGSAARLSGDVEEAEWAFGEVAAYGQATHSEFLSYVSAYKHSDTLLLQGRLRAAEALLDKACAALERAQSPLSILAEVYAAQSELATWRNQLDDARALLQRALELAEQTTNYTLLINATIQLVHLREARGEYPEAEQALRRAETIAQRFQSASMRTYLAAIGARLALSRGDVISASRWADEQVEPLAAGMPLLLGEYAGLTLARIRRAQGEHAAALTLVEQARQLAEAQGRFGSLIEILVHQGLCLAALGKHEQAGTDLQHALALAAPEGIIRPFVAAGPVLARQLEGLRLRHPGVTTPHTAAEQLHVFAGQLLAAMPPVAAAAPNPNQALVEPLSQRELEVLQLLAAGTPNSMIADRLVVSVGTVKSHVNHILGKLGAHNRTEAVALARGAGLLDDQ